MSQLKLSRVSEIDEAVFMSLVLQSETSMVVSRLLGIKETLDDLFVQVRWKGLQTSRDLLESIARAHEEVPGLFEKMPLRKSITPDLAAKVRAELDF